MKKGLFANFGNTKNGMWDAPPSVWTVRRLPVLKPKTKRGRRLARTILSLAESLAVRLREACICCGFQLREPERA